MQINTDIYEGLCACVCMHVCMCVCMYLCMYVYIHVHICMYMWKCVSCMDMCLCMDVELCTTAAATATAAYASMKTCCAFNTDNLKSAVAVMYGTAATTVIASQRLLLLPLLHFSEACVPACDQLSHSSVGPFAKAVVLPHGTTVEVPVYTEPVCSSDQ
jgi:hypothetical protein